MKGKKPTLLVYFKRLADYRGDSWTLAQREFQASGDLLLRVQPNICLTVLVRAYVEVVT